MPARRTSLALAGALSAALALGACGGEDAAPAASGSASPSADGPSVVASTNVYGSIAQAVAGDAATVTSIIDDPSADPHSYEGSTRDQLAISRADVVVENGGGYDEFVSRMLDTSGASGVVRIDAVELSGKEPADDHADDHADEHTGSPAAGEEHAHEHGGFNEHVWYDLPTVRRVAAAVEDALAKASPADAATYERNLAAFTADLDRIQQQVDAAKPAVQGAPVAVTEPVPGYLLDALGAEDRTPEDFSEAIEEETDVPAGVLQETLSLFSDPSRRVRALVYNEQTTGPQTEEVQRAAQENGVPVVGVTETLPEGEDYTTWMTDNVTRVVAALQPR